MPACKLCNNRVLAMHGLCAACWSSLKKKIINHLILINKHEKVIMCSYDYDEVLSSLKIIENALDELLQYKRYKIGIQTIVEIMPPSPPSMAKYIRFCRDEYNRVLQQKSSLDKELNSGEPVGRKYHRELSTYESNKSTFRKELKKDSPRGSQKYKAILSAIRRIRYILGVQAERISDAHEFELGKETDKAIALYTKNVNNELWDKASYDRLLKLYRDKKLYGEELRIVDKARAMLPDKKYKKRYKALLAKMENKKSLRT